DHFSHTPALLWLLNKGSSMSPNMSLSVRLSRVLLLTVVFTTSLCLAQTSGSLSGTVLDDIGKPVAASVTVSRVTMPPSNARAQAGLDGAFSIANLSAGTYT